MAKEHSTAEKLGLTEADKDIIRAMLGEQATEEHFQRFIRTCELAGLSPITRQIYGRIQNTKTSKRRGDQFVDVYTPELVIITGIDGFRAAAERTGAYLGQTTPEYFFKDASMDHTDFAWRDFWIGSGRDVPELARVGIRRVGFPEPVYGVARFASYAQYTGRGNDRSLSTFWAKMPEVMIAKVAEALGFRKCFPMLAGLYLEEEIGKGDDEPETTQPAPVIERDNAVIIKPGQHIETQREKAENPPEPEPEEDNVPMGEPHAEPEPTPEPPKKPATAKKTAKPAQQPAAEAKTSTRGAESGWRGHKITCLTMAKWKNRSLGQIVDDTALKGPKEIESMWIGFGKKFHGKFVADDANEKVHECVMIQAAYQELFPEAKNDDFDK